MRWSLFIVLVSLAVDVSPQLPYGGPYPVPSNPYSQPAVGGLGSPFSPWGQYGSAGYSPYSGYQNPLPNGQPGFGSYGNAMPNGPNPYAAGYLQQPPAGPMMGPPAVGQMGSPYPPGYPPYPPGYFGRASGPGAANWLPPLLGGANLFLQPWWYYVTENSVS